MRVLNGRTYYSPSDLTLFHDSPFASWCEQSYRATEKTFPTPDAEDEFQKILQQRGYAHEEWLVQHLSEQDRTVLGLS
ncbi:hypothetical protein [Pseudidiomarina salilacus]|uniref:hypothetical protein n=1 Tax=Pseudidiomarina salilacus TaxID=3384452 RepID=UPI0039847CDD